VEIRLQDEGDFRWKGRLDFTDNGLDPRSGTIRGRAVLSNPELFLTAGMFGNMRLSNGGEVDALLVPDEAIQSIRRARSCWWPRGRRGGGQAGGTRPRCRWPARDPLRPCPVRPGDRFQHPGRRNRRRS
jgi:hypothetical protein